MKMCKLKNGAVESKVLVKAIMESIKLLGEITELTGQMALYELGKKAQNSSYNISDETVTKILVDLHLMDQQGKLKQEVKNVAESAISFDDDHPILDNPIVEVL